MPYQKDIEYKFVGVKSDGSEEWFPTDSFTLSANCSASEAKCAPESLPVHARKLSGAYDPGWGIRLARCGHLLRVCGSLLQC